MKVQHKKLVSAFLTMAVMLTSASAVFAADVSNPADGGDIVVTEGGNVLVKDTDYTLEYKDNVKVGTATVTIHFIGNYSGEKEQTFDIIRKSSSGGMPVNGGGGGGGSHGGGGTSRPDKPEQNKDDKPAPSQTPDVTPSPEPTKEPEAYDHCAYIHGYEDGRFIPDGEISRAETAAMLYRAIGTGDKTVNLTLTDLKPNAWYVPAVTAMAETGVVKGYDDGTFKPDNFITRAEFAAMIARLTKSNAADAPFTDISGHWAAEYITACYDAGYIDGYDDGTFKPDNLITRAEAVKMINAALDRTDLTNTENPFPDVQDTHWAYKNILEAAVNHNVK